MRLEYGDNDIYDILKIYISITNRVEDEREMTIVERELTRRMVSGDE